MNTEPRCPACGHDKCVPGTIEPGDPDAPDLATFHPRGVKHWIRYQGVRLRNGTRFHCCLKCGLTWSFSAAEEVMSMLHKQGVAKGEVPVPASYFAHLAKWIVFILIAAAAILWSAATLG